MLDKLDHTFIVRKSKNGYILHSKCTYPNDTIPKQLKQSLLQNYQLRDFIESLLIEFSDVDLDKDDFEHLMKGDYEYVRNQHVTVDRNGTA